MTKKQKKVQHIKLGPITEREIREYVRSLIQRGLASRAILGAGHSGHSRDGAGPRATNQTTQQYPLKRKQS